ncbi:hypothetical protein ALC56_06964 [Trachymyrmex septentrionalis]|uniref:Uncharacterized protein n=1 Tax=Trachymyrmex septentrionalis TaxID=34720 RepID=A0A151JWR4_9HYME|nr:hypothetical protein ALC56_06964 [Trachymyrmex septentrionalis]
MKNTTIQLSKRQSTIHHLRPWPSSMDGAASKVVLYQKYAVSELLTHSSTGFPSNTGHFAHGNDAIPIPPSQGCIVFHTPRAPCRIRCPRPNSIRKRGTPSRISITKKGMRKAPETYTHVQILL